MEGGGEAGLEREINLGRQILRHRLFAKDQAGRPCDLETHVHVQEELPNILIIITPPAQFHLPFASPYSAGVGIPFVSSLQQY